MKEPDNTVSGVRRRGERGATKRAKGEGALFQRGDGYWIARIDIGWNDEGKKIRLEKKRKDKAAAVAALRQLRKDYEEYGHAATGRATVETWMTYWLDNVLRVRPNTHQLYRGIARNHIVPSIGKRRLDQLEPRHVRAMLTTMEKKGLTSLRRQAFTVLGQALKDARSEGRITRVVTDAMKAPNPLKTTRTPLTAAQARNVLRHVADDRLGGLWASCLLGGLRRGEALGLQWSTVDLDADVMDVSKQVQRIGWRHGCGEGPGVDKRWPCGKKYGGSCPDREPDTHVDYEYRQLFGGLYLVEPKSRKGARYVPIVPSLHAALTSRREAWESERGGYTNDHHLVFPRPDGQPYDPKDATRMWGDMLRDAGVPVVDLHSARHSTATLLLEAGTDVGIVEAIMGHAAAATSRGYQHVSHDLARQAMLKMEQLLELERGDNND